MTTYKWLHVINNIMLSKAVMASKELKNRVVSCFQNVVCIDMWSLVMYSNYLGWNLAIKQMVVNFSAMLLLKVHLCLILFITVSLHINNGYIYVHV